MVFQSDYIVLVSFTARLATILDDILSVLFKFNETIWQFLSTIKHSSKNPNLSITSESLVALLYLKKKGK